MMAALFQKPKFPEPAQLSDQEIEDARRRELAARKGGGRASTVLTGGAGVGGPILGSAAALSGGI